MNLTKTAFMIGAEHGLVVEIYERGDRIASAELMLPAHDDAMYRCIDQLKRQCEAQGMRINGRQKQALFHEIEMGVVT